MGDGKGQGRPESVTYRRLPDAEGLGDTVADMIHRLTGITPCEKCRRRREWLNKKFPYRKPGAPDPGRMADL